MKRDPSIVNQVIAMNRRLSDIRSALISVEPKKAAHEIESLRADLKALRPTLEATNDRYLPRFAKIQTKLADINRRYLLLKTLEKDPQKLEEQIRKSRQPKDIALMAGNLRSKQEAERLVATARRAIKSRRYDDAKEALARLKTVAAEGFNGERARAIISHYNIMWTTLEQKIPLIRRHYSQDEYDRMLARIGHCIHAAVEAYYRGELLKAFDEIDRADFLLPAHNDPTTRRLETTVKRWIQTISDAYFASL